MKLTNIFDLIFEAGKQQGMGKGDVARRAGINPASLSRMIASGNAHFDKVEALANAVGMELTVIQANPIARGLASGALFEG